MKRILVVMVALSFFYSACGISEEQKMSEPAETMAMVPGMSGHAMGGAMAEDSAAMAQEEQATAAEAAGGEDAAAGEKVVVAQVKGDPVKGKQVYDSICFACHAQGVAGAPKLGDKALWGPRIAQGMDVLVSHAINGFTGNTGTMPPKGGRVDLSDEDMLNCVSYMVGEASK